MGKLNINGGGVDTNKKMASIDERFGPYTSTEAADAALGGQGRNTITAGLTVGILTANAGVKEYWYQPNKKSGVLELIPKGGKSGDTFPEGNFASFDENGNVVDSGCNEGSFIKGVQKNGADLTPDANGKVNVEVQDGKSAYQLYVDEYEEAHGGSTEGVLEEDEWLDSLDAYGVYVKETTDNPVMTRGEWLEYNRGKSAREIYNQEKGTDYDDARFIEAIKANYPMKYVEYDANNYNATGITAISGITAGEATEGKLWFMPNNDNTETKLFITVNIGTAEVPNYKWYNMGVVRVPSNALTEEMVDNECSDGAIDKPASAKAVMDLKAKLEGVTASETKVTTIEDWYPEGSSSGYYNTSKEWTTNTNFVSTRISINNYKRVRFIGYNKRFTTKYAYGFLDDDSRPIGDFIEYYNAAIQTEGKCELEVEVPAGAAYFVCIRQAWSTNSAYQMFQSSDFYCYLQSGTSVGKELADKASYSEMEGLWMWKKNLINQDDLKHGGIYTQDGVWDNTGSEASGIVSNKLYLEDGVAYTVSNANGYKTLPVAIGDSCILCITKFDANGNFLETYRPTGKITATDGGLNSNAAKSTFTYSKHRNAETGEIDEAYCVIRLRYNASSLSNFPNTYYSYKSAQVEVGDEVTELAPYLSEKVFDIATKEYVDGKITEAVAPIQEQIDAIDENITTEEEVAVAIERDYEFKDGNGVWLHKYLTTANTLIEDPDNVLALTPKSSTWAVIRYQVDGDKTYRGRTYTTGGYSGNVIYYWATEDKRLISRTTDTKTKANIWVEEDITSPQNAKYLYVLVLKNNINSATLYEISNVEKTIKEVVEEKEENLYKSIKILAKKKVSLKVLVIGDSFVIDSFAYVPIMLQKMYKDIDFVIGIAMESYQLTPDIGLNGFYHGTIAAHLRFLTIQEEYDQYNYYKYSSDNSSWSYSEKKLKDTLTDEDWDCIIIRANYQSGITSDGNIKFIDNDDPNTPTHVNGYGDNYDYNNLVDRLRNAIMKHVNHPIKFGALIPQTSPKDSLSSSITDSLDVVNAIDTRIQNVFSAAQLYMQYSFFDFVVPVGTAIQNARHIPQIRALGDAISYLTNNTNAGYMNCSDAHHLQDGIGREICAYTICLKLLELACNQKSILGDKDYILKEDVNNYLVPAPKGSTAAGFIVKDDNYSDTKNKDIENYNQCLLRIIQKCSQFAVKNPYTIETKMDTICAADIEELNSLKSAIDGEN